MDLYRGTLSPRRLALLIRQLPAESALVRARNGGTVPWTNLEHRVADLWALWAKKDHPVRAEMEADLRMRVKRARVVELKAVFQKRNATYGLGDAA